MEQLNRPDGTRIHYVTLGEGAPTCIFLHGWTANAREWLPFASELTEQQSICWDARGHGDHPCADQTEMTLAAMAADLDALITELALDKVILIGHSMGALISWEYIRRYGQARLAAQVVIDQSPKLVTDKQWQLGVYGGFTRQQNEALLQRLQDNFAEGVLELIGNSLNHRSRENYQQNSRGFQQMRHYLQQQPGPLLSACWDSITQQDYRALLPRIQCPVLLVYGQQSQFYNQALQSWIQAQLPDACFLLYENADHSPHLWHKERFIYDLKHFIQRLQPL